MWSTDYLPPGVKEFVERHPKFRRVLAGFSYLFSERILKIIIGVFVHALLARHLGPDHFGKLSYVVKTVTIFFVFGSFGVDELIIKHLLEARYSEEDIYKTVIRIRLKMSLIGLLVLATCLIIFNPEGWLFSLITLLYGMNIFLQAFNVFELKFHARIDFLPLFWANNISYITASGLRILGVFLNGGITFFLGTYIWGEIVQKTLIFKNIGWKKAFSGIQQPRLKSELIKGSFPFFLSSFVMILDQRISYLFIEKFRSLSELGYYSVAVTLVDLWIFLPTAICSSVFPTIITSFNGDKKKYNIRIQYLSDVVVWVAFAFSVGVLLTSKLVIQLLYGDGYTDAPHVLELFALTTIPVFFNLVRIKWMTLENLLGEWLWINLICLLLNLIGHIYFVPMYGVSGAIGSFLASQLLGNIIMIPLLESSRKSALLFLKTLTFPYRIFKKLK